MSNNPPPALGPDAAAPAAQPGPPSPAAHGTGSAGLPPNTPTTVNPDIVDPLPTEVEPNPPVELVSVASPALRRSCPPLRCD